MANSDSLTSPDGWTAMLAAGAALLAVIAAIIVMRNSSEPMAQLKLATGYALLIFLFFLSMMVLLEIARNKIDLSEVLEELSGGASMSRFQLLIFTFVFGFTFFIVVVNAGKLPDIPGNVLTLLGISASTYAVSKGLQVTSGQVTPSDGDETAGADSSEEKGG